MPHELTSESKIANGSLSNLRVRPWRDSSGNLSKFSVGLARIDFATTCLELPFFHRYVFVGRLEVDVRRNDTFF